MGSSGEVDSSSGLKQMIYQHTRNIACQIVGDKFLAKHFGVMTIQARLIALKFSECF
jgi:hypothetical protein